LSCRIGRPGFWLRRGVKTERLREKVMLWEEEMSQRTYIDKKMEINPVLLITGF
jgi:hypothetical protein